MKKNKYGFLLGLGFSSTRKDKVRVLVQQGTGSKAYEIQF